MTQEDKQLLLKDLCSRLPYNVVIRCTDNDTDYKCFLTTDILNELLHNTEYYGYKPYLRPMSSMTDKEKTKIASMAGHFNSLTKSIEVCFACLPVVDYCYSRHLDIHGLIEKGLALEAPEGMYKTE